MPPIVFAICDFFDPFRQYLPHTCSPFYRRSPFRSPEWGSVTKSDLDSGSEQEVGR
jgi:hypothetical protein